MLKKLSVSDKEFGGIPPVIMAICVPDRGRVTGTPEGRPVCTKSRSTGRKIGIPCIPFGPPIPVPDRIGIPYIPVGQKKRPMTCGIGRFR